MQSDMEAMQAFLLEFDFHGFIICFHIFCGCHWVWFCLMAKSIATHLKLEGEVRKLEKQEIWVNSGQVANLVFVE